jgi:hypothetical protein
VSQRVVDEYVRQWAAVINDSTSEVIPAFAAVLIVGLDVATGLVRVKKPDADSSPVVWFVSSAAIPAGGTGLASSQIPIVALYDLADGPPTQSMSWGTKSGQYSLAKDKGSLRWCFDAFATEGVGFFDKGAFAGVGECVATEVVSHATVACVDGTPQLTLTKVTINRVNCSP